MPPLTVPLSIAERKHRIPRGAQTATAEKFGLSTSYVSEVVNGEVHPKTADAKKRLRAVQVWIARKYFRLPVALVFPETEQEAAPVLARAS